MKREFSRPVRVGVAVLAIALMVAWYLLWNDSESDAAPASTTVASALRKPGDGAALRGHPKEEHPKKAKTAFVLVKKNQTAVSKRNGKKYRHVKRSYCLGNSGYPTSRKSECASTKKSVCKPYPAKKTYMCATGKPRTKLSHTDKVVLKCGGLAVIGVVGAYWSGGVLAAGGVTAATGCFWSELF